MGKVRNSNSVRQTGWVFRPGGLYSLVKRIPQEILARFWLDSNKTIPVLGFQFILQVIGIDSPGTIDDRFRLG
jgi:hypothetical protein